MSDRRDSSRPRSSALWLATLGAFATFGMLVLALPLYVKDELGYGSVGVGLAVGAASLTSVVFSVVSGRLGDRHGRRPLLVVGGLVMFGCYLALALLPGLAGVVGIRFVAGAAEATFVVGALHVDDGHLAGGAARRGGQPDHACVVPRAHVRPGARRPHSRLRPVSARLAGHGRRRPRRDRGRGHASRDEAGDRGAVVEQLATAARRAPPWAARRPGAVRLRRLRRVRRSTRATSGSSDRG